jgi:dihydroflavonol-4-reductase
VAQCARLVGLARRAGVRRVLVVGSYFSHFDRVWPELRLAESHCYIRSRKEQEAAVLGESGRGMDTMVLELPYVFGTMPGRKPRWTILVDLLGGMGRIVPYPLRSGGTARVTARQAAAAAAGALEGGEGGKPYLVGGTNMPWSEFIPLVLSCIGKGQRAVHLPKLFYKLGKARMARDRAREGKEGGLDLVALAEIMYREAYIDPAAAMGELGYGEDDVRAAIRETIAECIRP